MAEEPQEPEFHGIVPEEGRSRDEARPQAGGPVLQPPREDVNSQPPPMADVPVLPGCAANNGSVPPLSGPEQWLPPDPDPDWACRDRVWVDLVPVLIDAAGAVPDRAGLLATGDPDCFRDTRPDDSWGGDPDSFWDACPDDPWGGDPELEPAADDPRPDPRELLPEPAAGPVDPSMMGYGEAVDALSEVRRARSFLDARQARLLARMHALALEDCPAAAEPEGTVAMAQVTEALSAAAVAEEAAALLRIPRGEAAAGLEAARRLTGEFTATLAALEEGSVTGGQAAVVMDQAYSLPEAARGRFEAELLRHGSHLARHALARKARVLREKCHPETIAARRAKAEEGRCVELRPLEDGMAWLGLYLPAEQAVGAFNRVQDAALALRSSSDQRTLTQLRADVAAALLLSGTCPGTEAATGPDTSGPSRPVGGGITAQVVVTVPALSLLGADDTPADLQGYGPIPAAVAARLAAGAPSLARILTDPATCAPLALDRTSYRLTSAQRRWLAAVHPECTFIGCQRSTRTCDADHTVAWARGHGSTDVDNLKPRCRGHHRLKTAGLWAASQKPGEHTSTNWTSPAGRIYTDTPEPIAATGPEALSTLLERLELSDLNRRPPATGARRRSRSGRPGTGGTTDNPAVGIGKTAVRSGPCAGGTADKRGSGGPIGRSGPGRGPGAGGSTDKRGGGGPAGRPDAGGSGTVDQRNTGGAADMPGKDGAVDKPDAGTSGDRPPF